MRRHTPLLCAIVAAVAILHPTQSAGLAIGADNDRDGIVDEREQELLHQFQPTFLVSRTDCATLPAEFLAGSSEPRVRAQQGTIYGQVFPLSTNADGSKFIEIHYYHLWARDCGLASHFLDAEHVSVVVTSEPQRASRAVAWYAAAHEGTLCDNSTGVKASVIQAEDSGATVWVSHGKHASFFSVASCNGGCGQDQCRDAVMLPSGEAVNIGETEAPLNGAVWTASPNWPMKEKMQSDFPGLLLTRLANSDGEVRIAGSKRRVQPVLSAGGTSINAMGAADLRSSNALTNATTKTGVSLRTGAGKLHGFLRRSGRAVRDSITSTR
ncbi:MAG: hypothetical protein AB7O65_03875 [Candidatus Korobacteraceae bacterium]